MTKIGGATGATQKLWGPRTLYHAPRPLYHVTATEM